MVFRPLTFQDKDAIAAILNSQAQSPIVGVSWTLDTILAELEGGCCVFGAQRVASEPLEAFVAFNDLGKVLEILLIYSHKNAPGAGQRALQALINANPQAEEIWLEVHEQNQAAIRFYERQGFVKVSQRSHYYPDGGAAFNYTCTLKRQR